MARFTWDDIRLRGANPAASASCLMAGIASAPDSIDDAPFIGSA